MAIYQATNTLIEKLDSIQSSFLKRLGYTEEDAFKSFKIAPLCLRRDIAMLGFIQKIV